MAVEFHMKMRSPLDMNTVLSTAAVHLHALGAQGTMEARPVIDELWGASEEQVVVSYGGLVEVSLLCHSVGPESEFGYEGGFWLAVTADRIRTGAAALVSLVIAVSAAELAESEIVDESLLLDAGRLVPPERALAVLSQIVGQADLSILGQRFGDRIGLPSGS